jgi:hypothetical protein
MTGNKQHHDSWTENVDLPFGYEGDQIQNSMTGRGRHIQFVISVRRRGVLYRLGDLRTAVHAPGSFDGNRSAAVWAGVSGFDDMQSFGAMGRKNDGDQAEYTEKQTGSEPSKDLVASITFGMRYDHAGNSTPDAHHENEHPA